MVNRNLILELYKIGLIKFGKFTFKSGIVSPNYMDHRILVSYPKILRKIAKEYVPILERVKYDRMIAVPYTALPIVCAISLQNNKPWIYTRKEAKEYGTKKLIEGEFEKGETAILVDDVITNGGSKIEVIEKIKDTGLKIKNIVVFIDREQGGKEEMEKKGYRLHSVLKLRDIFKVLFEEQILSKEQYKENIDSLIKNRRSL